MESQDAAHGKNSINVPDLRILASTSAVRPSMAAAAAANSMMGSDANSLSLSPPWSLDISYVTSAWVYFFSLLARGLSHTQYLIFHAVLCIAKRENKQFRIKKDGIAVSHAALMRHVAKYRSADSPASMQKRKMGRLKPFLNKRHIYTCTRPGFVRLPTYRLPSCLLTLTTTIAGYCCYCC